MIELNWRLAGGISTLGSGFSFCEVPQEKGSDRPTHLLCNAGGDCIAHFWSAERRMEKRSDCDRADLEAIEGFKVLILGWR